jgi:hypothetical protein
MRLSATSFPCFFLQLMDRIDCGDEFAMNLSSAGAYFETF